MTAPPASHDVPVALDDEGRLTEDIPCRRCGYNLRGLALDRSCPECATAVGRSVHGDLLRFCDPGWVGTLAAGAKLLVIAVVAEFGLGLAYIVAMATAFFVGMPVGVAAAGLILVAAVVAAIQIIAFWKLTTPDPGKDETGVITVRSAARYALVAATVLGMPITLGELNLSGMLGSAINLSTTSELVFHAVGFAALAINVVGSVALFVYARSIALRVPDDRLASRTRLVMWGLLVPSALVQGLERTVAAMYVGAAPPPKTVENLVVGVSLLLSVPVLVFVIWAIVLMFQYRRRLIAAAGQATATWAAPSGPG